MAGRILVLGAAGRLGFSAAAAFRDAQWEVKGLVRPGAGERAPKGIEVIETFDRAEAIAAARGTDIVLHALNPIYTAWARYALPLAYSAIEAAETAGATLLFPGNVYNFGRDMPELLDENTPMQPTARKGRLRLEIEARLGEASQRGMRTIILRAGDFFGFGRGSWFDLAIVKDFQRDRITYPGPLDVLHSWAYLPDLVAAMVKLAERHRTLSVFESFGFPGHAVTGQEFVGAIVRACGRPLRVKELNWWIIRSVGRLTAMGRELSEIAYLWQVPHRISGTKLESVIGSVPHTPLDAAIAQSLRELGLLGAAPGGLRNVQ